jgi:pentatricopeptide repeat protein
MISGYVQNGTVDEGMELFQKMPKHDVVSWNTMIARYAQKGYNKDCWDPSLEHKLMNRDKEVVNITQQIHGQRGQ